MLDEGKSDLIKEDENLKIHLPWFEKLKEKYANLNENNIDEVLEDEVGNIFVKVLEHCGVFKWNEDGKEAIKRYIKSVKEYIEVKECVECL